MTYTLFMPADQGIRVADDGVAEVSMTEARALLTRLIRTVREDGPAGAFTERGERRAYVVTPDFMKTAEKNAALLSYFAGALEEMPESLRHEQWAQALWDLRNEAMHGRH